MRGDLVSRIEPAKQFRAPFEQAKLVIYAELEPVEAFRIAAETPRRVHELPFRIAIAVPRLAQVFHGAVFCP
jgi:hypothetical protein